MKKIILKYDLIALFLASVAVVFMRLGFHSYDLDEAFSLHVSKNLGSMVSILWNQESNMWLYYFLLSFWQLIGTNEFVIRSLSAVFAAVAVVLVYKIAAVLFDRQIARISALLIMLNVFFVYTAQLARGYSLFLLLSLGSTYCYLIARGNVKVKYAYMVLSIASIFTHYYAFFVLFSHALFALSQKRFWSYVKLGWPIIISLPIIALAPSFTGGQVDWIQIPNFVNLLGTAFTLSGDFPPLFIVYGLLFVITLRFLIRNLRNEKIQFLLLWMICPIVVAYIFSIVVKPVYQSVYFIGSLPPFIILASYLLSEVKTRHLRSAFLSVIIIFSLARLVLWFNGDLHNHWVFSNTSEDWRALAHYVDIHEDDGDAKIFFGYHNRVPYGIYAKDKATFVEISSGLYSLGGGSRLPQPNNSLIRNFSYSRVWLVKRNADMANFNDTEMLDQIEKSLKKNYELTDEINFSELSLKLWEKI